MARTRPLTQAQREEEARKRVCQSILDRLNEKRGRERKSNQQFAEEIGIGKTTWYEWNKGKIDQCEFGRLLTALYRSGIELDVLVRS